MIFPLFSMICKKYAHFRNVYNLSIVYFPKIGYNVCDYAKVNGGSVIMFENIGGLIPIILMVVVVGAMFIFTNRSEKKRQKEQNDMRNNLTVGDEITTTGGIIGKVVSIKDETCVIETTHERTKIRILRTAVAHVDVKAEDSGN